MSRPPQICRSRWKLTLPALPSKWEKWRRLLEPWVWTLRYLGIAALFLVVYFLILRPVKKQAVAAFKAVSYTHLTLPTNREV